MYFCMHNIFKRALKMANYVANRVDARGSGMDFE